jgi:hypothetical protein
LLRSVGDESVERFLEIDHAKYQQSKAESRKKLVRSPILFVIVQDTRDPHFQLGSIMIFPTPRVRRAFAERQ